jgi:predicted permease
MAPRLTGVLRQWLQNDSGYPPNWMPDVRRTLSKQVINIVPAGAGVAEMKDYYWRSLQILMAVCGVVLLIVCANVANLLLARAASRRGQTAVRLALGAARSEIVIDALTESVVLALAGAIAGLAVARGAARLLVSLAIHNAPFLPLSTAPSVRVLVFACGLALVTAILFGAAPAWFATRADPVEALRGAGRGSIGHASFAGRALLVAQAALSVVLVAGATMLGRSLNNLERQDFGFQIPGRVLVALEDLPSTYSLPKLQAIYRELEMRLNRLPGVAGAGLALYNPLTSNWGELIMVAGHPPARLNEDSGASWDRVSATYLQNLGMRIVRGRDFTAADNETTAPVAVVNRAFVKRFFRNGEEPIGQYFGLGEPENAGTFRIVGVVNDAKFQGFALRRPALPMFFVPLAQNVNYHDKGFQRLELESHFVEGLLMRTRLPVGTLESVLRKTLAEVDPNLTVTRVRTLEEHVALSLDRERAVAGLAGLFGILALLLAAVGLYGVTAYGVAQRTNEIGIRMALGADRARVIRLVLRGALQRVLLGLLFGVPLAVGAGRLIAAELYGVSSWDPFALGVAAGALSVCTLVAALIPARRAASISPMDALRAE